MMSEFVKDKLRVNIFSTRTEMGMAAARDAVKCIQDLLSKQEEVNIVFAAAPSQNDFLLALKQAKEIDWTRVNAFHMDEYIGLPEDAPQGFGNFLKSAIFNHLPFSHVFFLYDSTTSTQDNISRYEAKLKKHPIDIVFMGIGENGHIAFNDPHVAFFNDPMLVKPVDLDLACRIQQVNDGCFSSLEKVPTHAVTLTIPALMRGKHLFCMVPTIRKAQAVKDCIEGEISERCPASILRTHASARLYLDVDSASLLEDMK